MSDRSATKHPLGALVTEGKTKKVYLIKGGAGLVTVVAKDDITAGDGAKHDIIPDKGRLATATTSNVFGLLKSCGLPVAFVEQDSATAFVAPNCTMLPYEVVVRREAHGSYLKRNPHFAKGQLFPQLIVEFFLKTKDKNWKGKPLVCDDPLIVYAKEAGEIRLFNPAKPVQGQEPFLVLPQAEVFSRDDEWKLCLDMARIARKAFLVLEKAWQLEGGTLVDFKVEFGFDGKGNLLLADVIDNDSWRVLEDGAYIDKQVYRDGGAQIRLFNPAKPILGSEPFLTLPTADVFSRPEEHKFFPEMRRIARQAFLVLEKAWALEGGTLVDFKVEFGFDDKGKLLLADVIDNDSWRVLENGAYIDKQVYRDGGALDTVAAKYRQVAEITSHFRLPRQRLILWRGSESDKTEAFADALGDLKDLMTVVTCSIHKEPVAGAGIFNKMVQELPDSVVIAFIGRSNGAGPVLSAQSTVPVITVPASAKDFPEDVWSSLRAPSKVPVMTVLEPANAVLAALQILSARNPRVYAHLRSEIESRMVNTITL